MKVERDKIGNNVRGFVTDSLSRSRWTRAGWESRGESNNSNASLLQARRCADASRPRDGIMKLGAFLVGCFCVT